MYKSKEKNVHGFNATPTIQDGNIGIYFPSPLTAKNKYVALTNQTSFDKRNNNSWFKASLLALQCYHCKLCTEAVTLY
jgi:hypothetical protein